MPLLSVIVPAYNEAQNIPNLVTRVNKALADIDYELIIVDDGSNDNSAEVAKKYATRYHVKVIKLETNRGKAIALERGVKAAEGHYVTFLDADMEYPPEALPMMLQKAREGHDVVTARRIDRRPLHRRIISIGSRALARLLIPKLRRYKDPTTELILTTRDIILRVGINPKYIKPFLPILLVAKNPFELSVSLDVRRYGKSSIKVKWIFMYIYELIDLIIHNYNK